MQVEESSLLNENSKLKIVFLGESSVGKTSLVQFISNGSFNSAYDPTVYLDSVRKNVMHQGKMHRLVLWDTAGQEKFNSLVPSSIRGSDCAVIVFAVSDRESFMKCVQWIQMLRECSSGNQCPAILVGNKTDLVRVITKEEAYQFANKYGMTYMESSAKLGNGIQNLVANIIQITELKIEKSTNSSEGSGTQKSLKSSKSVKKPSTKLQLKKPKECCCSI